AVVCASRDGPVDTSLGRDKQDTGISISIDCNSCNIFSKYSCAAAMPAIRRKKFNLQIGVEGGKSPSKDPGCRTPLVERQFSARAGIPIFTQHGPRRKLPLHQGLFCENRSWRVQAPWRPAVKPVIWKWWKSYLQTYPEFERSNTALDMTRNYSDALSQLKGKSNDKTQYLEKILNAVQKMAMDVQTTCFLTYGEKRTESSSEHKKRNENQYETPEKKMRRKQSNPSKKPTVVLPPKKEPRPPTIPPPNTVGGRNNSENDHRIECQRRKKKTKITRVMARWRIYIHGHPTRCMTSLNAGFHGRDIY
ncbi:hypothetical protein L9F63_009846, partial [Diploptera punctata]